MTSVGYSFISQMEIIVTKKQVECFTIVFH